MIAAAWYARPSEVHWDSRTVQHRIRLTGSSATSQCLRCFLLSLGEFVQQSRLTIRHQDDGPGVNGWLTLDPLGSYSSLATICAFQSAQSGFCYSENDMRSDLKHFYFGLRALVLSLALFLGGIVVHAQEAAVAPPSADSKPATTADFIAAADEVLGQMSQITGLKLVTPLKKSLRSREEIRAYVIKQMNEDKNTAERYADQRSAEAFGLLPKGFDLDSSW